MQADAVRSSWGVPGTHARDPGADAGIPEGDTRDPGADAAVPEGDARDPGADAAVPEGDTRDPGADAAVLGTKRRVSEAYAGIAQGTAASGDGYSPVRLCTTRYSDPAVEAFCDPPRSPFKIDLVDVCLGDSGRSPTAPRASSTESTHPEAYSPAARPSIIDGGHMELRLQPYVCSGIASKTSRFTTPAEEC